MIRQDDRRLNLVQSNIRHKRRKDTGCAAMLPFWSANRISNLEISPRLIRQKHYHWQKMGWLGPEYTMLDWAAMHEDLGLRTIYEGHKDPDYPITGDQFAYGLWRNPHRIDPETGKPYEHFTAVVSCGAGWACTYDPLGRSFTVAEGVVVSLRVFTLV